MARDWKIELIEADNPHWEDLAVGLFGFEALPVALPLPFRHSRVRGNDEATRGRLATTFGSAIPRRMTPGAPA